MRRWTVVETRPVNVPRMLDAFTLMQRTKALEALLRHHDPRVVRAVLEALEASRG